MTFLLLSVPLASVHGHAELDRQIARVSSRIARDPENAALYLRRGELHRLHREFDAAREDYDEAERLDRDLAAVDLARGTLYLDAQLPKRALKALDRFLRRKPGHGAGLTVRARAQVRMGQWGDAVEGFSGAIRLLSASGAPPPELYLERAAATLAGDPSRQREAIAGLEEGLEQLGSVITLELRALELEVEIGTYQDALARVDRVTASLPRKEWWLARRGEILELAGRHAEAKHAFESAVAALGSLPAGRRQSRTAQRMERRWREAIHRLEARERSRRESTVPPTENPESLVRPVEGWIVVALSLVIAAGWALVLGRREGNSKTVRREGMSCRS